MMMDFGFYENGGRSSSSSSNLSALAPPFTFDRSVSKPLVDLTEPPLNWLNTHLLSLDSVHSSTAFCYPCNPSSTEHTPPAQTFVPITSTDSLLYGQNSDAIPSANLVEAKPFYPSYISATKYTYDDYAQSLSGLWDASRGWKFAEKVDLDENFCPRERFPSFLDYNDQGNHPSKNLKSCEQSTNNFDMLGDEQRRGSTNREQIDGTTLLEEISQFMPVEYPGKSILGTTDSFPESYSCTSHEQGQCWNYQTPYGDSYEKGVEQHGISPNDVYSIRKSSPVLVIKPNPVGSGPSAPYTSSFNKLESGSGTNNMDFANIKECNLLHSSGSKVQFDASQVSFHQEGGGHSSFQELPLGKKGKLSSNVLKDPFGEKAELQIPDHGRGGSSLMLASDGAINYPEGSFESLDHYNPAEDSPCWKGAPIYQISPLKNCGPVTPPLFKETQANSGPNSIWSNDSLSIPPQKPSDCSFNPKNEGPENETESAPQRPPVNLLFEENDLKAGSSQMKSSSTLGVQFSDYIDKPRQGYVFAYNSADELTFNLHCAQRKRVENKLTLEKKCEIGFGVADVGISDGSEGCSSRVPLNATEHVLSSPSVEEGPAKLCKLHGEDLAPQMCTRTLISTMHNLSELLLFHCSTEVFALKENDIEFLKQVVNNLEKCISKSMGQEALEGSVVIPKGSQFINGPPELREDVSESRPQLTKAAFSVLNQSNNEHVQEERIHGITSGKKDVRCSDLTAEGDDAEGMKNDNLTQVLEGDDERVKKENMTQAIKKVLGDNLVTEADETVQLLLYKNLWLEAEAALCSINYKARFDRMKIELEKCRSPKSKGVKCDSTGGASIQNFPNINTSSHPDNVIARFRILKCLESDMMKQMPYTDAELSSNCFSTDKDKVMVSEVLNDKKQQISACCSPRSSYTRHADEVEASVMDRFHILKSRTENSSSSYMTPQLLPQVPLKFDCGTLAVHSEPELQQNSANKMQEKLRVKDFQTDAEDDPIHIIQLPRENLQVNQFPATSYDSSSSGWEHVLKEELPSQDSLTLASDPGTMNSKYK